MNCSCTEQISSLIDGELSSVETRQLEQHLLSCEECREARADFLSLRSQITNFPVSSDLLAPRGALAAIVERAKPDSRRGSWHWVFNPAVAAVGGLLIVGAVITLLLYPRLKPTPSNAEIAKATGTKASPAPSPTRATEDVPKGRGQNNSAPKNSTPPANNDKTKAPSKKRAPLIVGPPQDNIATNASENNDTPARVRSADTETMTAIHFQKSELLLRSFRNVRLNNSGATPEISYERKLAQQLVYQNMILRREADSSGDAQTASLLESLEPILLDIANLPDKARQNQVRAIKDRFERKNIVALLQINSNALARALD